MEGTFQQPTAISMLNNDQQKHQVTKLPSVKIVCCCTDNLLDAPLVSKCTIGRASTESKTRVQNAGTINMSAPFVCKINVLLKGSFEMWCNGGGARVRACLSGETIL